MPLLLRVAHVCAAAVGAALVALSLLNIWMARIALGRNVYVSGLGADGEPTARWFEAALLLLVAGGLAVAWVARGIRSRARLLRCWPPALSIAAACALFLVASQVPCTSGCPAPVGDAFTWQDLTHTTSAVLAFALAAFAMLQVSFSDGHPALRRFSLATAVLVAVIAATGGIMSLLQFRTDIGSILEFVATTIGIGWLIVLGLLTGFAPAPRPALPGTPRLAAK